MSYVAVTERGCNGDYWRAAPDQYERILHAFESGAPFFTFTTIDGAETTVRSSEIVEVAFLSDAAIDNQKTRRAAEALES